MMQEFKDFINKGGVVEVAVAFVMGLAFKPIIDAVVGRVLMPLIGMLVGSPNFDTVGTFACGDGVDAETGSLNAAGELCAGSIGAVITATVSFILVAAALFVVVKMYNKTKAPEPEAAPEADPEDIVLLREIRDGLNRP